MRRVILSATFAISTLTACIYLQQPAHASWSDPTASQYDDSGSPLSDGVFALAAGVFAVYGFYKFATRND